MIGVILSVPACRKKARTRAQKGKSSRVRRLAAVVDGSLYAVSTKFVIKLFDFLKLTKTVLERLKYKMLKLYCS